MKRGTLLTMGVLLAGIGAAQPVITSLSTSSLPRSGRLRIFGTNFGATRGNSRVLIGGLSAWITRWSDTTITAYVPEQLSVGTHNVQVVTSNGSSNTLPLQVTRRQRQGRVLWRFQVDSSYIVQRPAIAPDGTIIVHDSAGFVYALQPDGGLKWIFQTPAFAYGPPSVDASGRVYVASISTIYALSPDGNLLWQFTDPNVSQGVIAGPTVGPNGNIYAVTDIGGLGAFSLSPNGQLRWSNPGNPNFAERGQVGVEIVFGRSRPDRAVDQLYVAFDGRGVASPTLYALEIGGNQRWAVNSGGQNAIFMQRQCQPAVGPDGTVYIATLISTSGWGLHAFDPSRGTLRWSFFPSPANEMSAPDVGSDGVVYTAHSLSYLIAVNPNGTLRWQFFDGGIIDYPVVSPNNNLVFAGERPDFGQPGLVRAYSTQNGQILWQVTLGVENGGNLVLYSRPRFTPDGTTVYFGTALLDGDPNNPYSYLYAVAMNATGTPGDINGDGCVDDADLLMVLFAFGNSGSGLPEDVNGDGVVDDADLLTVLFNFGSGC